jgi:Secretion system C-terminal sorting domain
MEFKITLNQFRLYLLYATSLIFISSLISCSTNEMEEEEGEEEEGIPIIYTALGHWGEMRTYPNKSLDARPFYQSYVRGTRMSVKYRQDQFGMNLPTTPPWTELGPKNFGGRILSIGFHPTNANIMYVGSASGGLWKTTNGGTGGAGGINWTFVPTGFPILGVASIVINPQNGNEVYIGTGEVYNSGALGTGATAAGHIRTFRGSYGIGILKSTDGGVTWRKKLDFTNSNIKGVMDMAIHPTTPDTIFAATTDGVYRTMDSGQTWNLIHNVPMAMDLHFKPGNPNVLYVGSGNFQTSNAGLYKTTNANAASPTFTKLAGGLPTTISGKIMISISPNNPNKVYASIGRDPTVTTHWTGLYYSLDEGASWTATPFTGNSSNPPSKVTNQGWYAHDIAAHPTNANIVIWGELDTWRSQNGFTTTNATGSTQVGFWSSWNINNTTVGTLQEGTSDNYVHADVHRILFSPHNSNTAFLCTDGGLFRTTDGGLNYQTLNGGLNTAQLYANIAIDPTDPNYVLCGLQDNEAMVYEGNPGCRRIGNLGDGFHSAIKSDGMIQFVESYYFNRRRSGNGGGSWSAGSGQVPELACFNVPLVYSQTAGSTTLFAGSILFKRSTNDGTGWSNLNSGNPIAGANNIIITMMAPNDNTVYFSTSPGGGIRSKLWKTTNASVASPTFTEITGTLPDRYYSDVAVDPTDPNRLAVALSGFGSSHVYLSTNGGSTWCNIGGGLTDIPANTVMFDPDAPGTLYVGNDVGVFYANSVPTGILGASYALTWVAYNEGFTDAMMVSDIAVTPGTPATRKLRIGSYGRGMWERAMAPTSTLPAKLKDFSGQRVNGIDELKWTVTLEHNVDRYEIEYSKDGMQFNTVGTQKATGLSGNEKLYAYQYRTDHSAIAYYRLKIIDLDGSYEYSEIVVINPDVKRSDIYVYPNPTSGIFKFHIPTVGSTMVNYRIYNEIGKLVSTKTISLLSGMHEYGGDISGLPPGTYRVVLEGKSVQWTGSLIKIK